MLPQRHQLRKLPQHLTAEVLVVEDSMATKEVSTAFGGTQIYSSLYPPLPHWTVH
jgi:hypothetical protein